MARTVIVKGRVVGPQTVELAEPLPKEAREVQVVAHLDSLDRRRVSEILRSFPSGTRTRTREQIDRELEEERDSWS